MAFADQLATFETNLAALEAEVVVVVAEVAALKAAGGGITPEQSAQLDADIARVAKAAADLKAGE